MCPPALGSAPCSLQAQNPQARGLSDAQTGFPVPGPATWDACGLNHGHAQEDLSYHLSETFCPWPCCPPPDLASPSPATLCPHPALALPLVFFAFLQTRQATKVLNPTRVPKASPPATTIPSSGTSTRVARSPAGHSLVRFHTGRAPQL